jgi:hypothetical protein
MQQLFRLRRFLDHPEPVRKAAGCELCGAELTPRHGHVADVEQRRILCSCRPCYMLFTHAGAANGRFRSVPERVVKLDAPELSGAGWERLDIPVGIAFFLRDSVRNRILAFYPSPAGATESGLPLETWTELGQAVPALNTLEADTEAVLVSRRDQGVEAWIVPVDTCYELVGRIRTQWRGLDGGREAWHEIDVFLESVREREGSCA